MWAFFFFSIVLSENLENSLVEMINNAFFFVSGESQSLYNEYFVLERNYLKNTTEFSIILLTNSSLSSELELHYIKGTYFNETATIKTHVNPAYEIIENSTVLSLNTNFNINLNQKYTQVSIFFAKTQKILLENEKNYTLIEVLYAADGNLYKTFKVFEGSLELKSFDWPLSSNTINKQKPSGRYLILIGLLITSGITAVVIYIYWNSKKSFPFVKLSEENAKIIGKD